MGKYYNQLQNHERDELSILLAQGFSYRTIGKMMGRSHTSISREVRRNSVNERYRSCAAAKVSKERSSNSNSYERLRNPELKS